MLMDKRQKKPVKRLQFTQSACRRQSVKYLDSQLSRTSSGRGSSSTSFKAISFFLFQQTQEGKEVLKVPCTLSAKCGRHSRVALAFMEFLRSGGSTVEVLHFGYIVPSHHSHLCCRNLLSSFFMLRGLKEEVDRMLQKGFWELADHLGPGYFSCLLLVQVSVGW